MESSWYDVSRNIRRQYLQTTKGDLCGHDIWRFCAGVPINDWNPERAFLQCTKARWNGSPTDVLCDHLGVLVFSAKLRSALVAHECASSDVQLLALSVFGIDGREIPGYMVANGLSLVSCLDRDRSFLLDIDPEEIDPRTDQPAITSIGRPAVFGEPLRGHDLVCLLEFPLIHLASHRFVTAFRSINATGLSFNPVMVDGCYA